MPSTAALRPAVFYTAGKGSIAGMVAVTALIAVPMSLTASALTRMNRVLQGAIGAITISIGGTILVRTSVLF